jgi:hypothetical protein
LTLPTPETLDRKIRELDKEMHALMVAAIRLRDPYRWAYFSGLQPSVGGDDKETGGRSRPVHEQNPTEGVITDARKRRLRAACQDSMRFIVSAIEEVTESTNVIKAVRERLGKSFGDNDILGLDRERYPKLVSEEELRYTESKVKERRSAGDSWGEG